MFRPTTQQMASEGALTRRKDVRKCNMEGQSEWVTKPHFKHFFFLSDFPFPECQMQFNQTTKLIEKAAFLEWAPPFYFCEFNLFNNYFKVFNFIHFVYRKSSINFIILS